MSVPMRFIIQKIARGLVELWMNYSAEENTTFMTMFFYQKDLASTLEDGKRVVMKIEIEDWKPQ